MSGRDDTGHFEGLHPHEHEHAGQPAHRHPHHHAGVRLPVHAHAHPTSFESLTYVVSPVHDLDARAKVLATAFLVLGVVATPPLRAAEFAGVCLLLSALTLIARLPARRLVVRSLAVLPAAATIALLAPLQARGGSLNAGGAAGGDAAAWVVAWSILSKAWLSAVCMLLLAATTRTPELLAALRRMGMPAVFVMLLSFIARYTTVLLGQLRALRTALSSRAPRLRRLVLLRALGGIVGNLFVRSYERGERVYAAMLSRGYTGTLPSAWAGRIGVAEVVLVASALMVAVSMALY